MTSPVPPAALAAARAAVPFVNGDAARRILEAAAPAIEAAERERCAQLAKDVGAAYVHQGEYTGGPKAGRPFADLLREQPPATEGTT